MEHKSLHGNRLRSAGYDVAEKTLEISFNNGQVRRFKNVPESVWRKLLAAPNPATYYEDRIEEEYAWSAGEKAVNQDARQQLDDLFGGPSSQDPRD